MKCFETTVKVRHPAIIQKKNYMKLKQITEKKEPRFTLKNC